MLERAERARPGEPLVDWRRYASEALGTFALVAVGPGAAMVAASTHAFGHTGVALAFGLAIAFVVAATGHLGGAHINPAVTVAFWSVRRFPRREVIPYVAAQCVGATVAAFALRWILGPVGQLGATVPAVSLGRAFAVEFGYSALLAFVSMGVATDERAPAGVAPFALGATVFAGALVMGPLTGGSFNPARTLYARRSPWSRRADHRVCRLAPAHHRPVAGASGRQRVKAPERAWSISTRVAP